MDLNTLAAIAAALYVMLGVAVVIVGMW